MTTFWRLLRRVPVSRASPCVAMPRRTRHLHGRSRRALAWGLACALWAAVVPGGTAVAATTAATTVATSASDVIATIEVVDDWGRTVRLARAPRRIVSLAPHITELLIAAGALKHLAAVDPDSDDPAVPTTLPRVNAYPSPQIERVLALRPELVVMWGAAVRRELVDRFTRLGVPVFVSDPRTHADIAASLLRFGMLAGEGETARRAVVRMRAALDAIAARHAGRTPVRVFVQVWNRPLMTLTDRDSIGEALVLCGAVNVFGSAHRAAQVVGPEAVIAAAPAMILAFEPAIDEQPWRDLAVLAPRGRIVFERIPRALQRASHKVVDAIAEMCATIDRHRRT